MSSTSKSKFNRVQQRFKPAVIMIKKQKYIPDLLPLLK